MRPLRIATLGGFLVAAMLPADLTAAEVAIFREVKGKVEYQLEGKDWTAAKVGVSLPKGALVSTGFKASASLEVMGSVIFIKPLTRMVLEDLVKTSTETKTGLKLLSGKVKTEVKPSSAASETVFEVKGPTATASVRGTGFEFDGENILVNHGKVEFANRYGQSRQVQGGEFSSAGKRGTVTPPIPVKPAEKPVITAEGGAEEVNALVGEEPSAPIPGESSASETPEAPGAAEDSPAPASGEAPAPEVPAVDLDLGNVIDTFGDTLLVDRGTPTAAEEIKKIQQETVAEQLVLRYQLTLELK